MMPRLAIAGFATAALVLALPVMMSAQRVSKRMFVRAVDTSGAVVTDLTKADFTLTENGVRREITRVTLGDTPMRIVLLVDSSTATSAMMNNFRLALNNFVDLVTEEHEIAFVTSGGQIRVRTQPSIDRVTLKAEIARFAAEGGANAFLETLIEADQRLLKPIAGQWPVLVIVTTDNGNTLREPDIPRYNKFMNDFLSRGGAAHAVVIAGKQTGPVTDLTQNLVQNVGGDFVSIVVDSNLPDRLKRIAQRLTEDYGVMLTRYEIEFNGDAKAQEAIIKIDSTRPNTQLQMSPRRPFQ